MVGGSGVGGQASARIDYTRVTSGLDAIDALAALLSNPEERARMRQEIADWRAAAEIAGVGADLITARKIASRTVDDAEITAKKIVAAADLKLAQAEQILASAQRDATLQREKANAVLKQAVDQRDSAERLMADAEAAASRAIEANEAAEALSRANAEARDKIEAQRARLAALAASLAP